MSDSLTVTPEMKVAPAAPIATTDPVQPTPAAAPEAPKADTPKETASALLSKLAKQKKEQMNLSKRLSSEQQEKQQLEARLKEIESKQGKKPTNPVEALQAAGYSYEDATKFLLNNSELTPDQQIAELRKELQERDKREQEKEDKRLQDQKERAERAVKEQEDQFKSDVVDFLETKKETFELTAKEDAQEVAETVLELIKEHWRQSVKEWEDSGRQGKRPKALSTEDALNMIEQNLEEKISSYIETNKIRSKFGPKAEPGKEPAPAQGQSKTLAASVTTSSTPTERIANPVDRAIRALEREGK